MKKVIKISMALLSAVTMLTACSSDSFVYPSNPITGTVPESEIPSEPTLHQPNESENLEKMKEACNFLSFRGEDGKLIEDDDLCNISGIENGNYSLECDFAYFTNTPSLYNGDPTDDADVTKDTKAYNEYLLSKAYIYRVKKGDKLDNGLICTDARTNYSIINNGTYFHNTTATFSGELTLTGTIFYHEEDPINGNGSISFVADSKNGNVPCVYRENFFPVIDCPSPSFYLGNISDLPENLASLINGKYTNVEITLKDIVLNHGNWRIEYDSWASVVDFKII